MGHAGLFIRTNSATFLCDPWFYPAYLDSWFPYPSNDHIEIAALGVIDYLFISSYSQDRLDMKLLNSLTKQVTVLIPNFKSDRLVKAFESLGFEKFIYLDNGTPRWLTDSLKVLTVIDESKMFGTIPRATIAIDDSNNKILIQDGRIDRNLLDINNFGSYDLHLVAMYDFNWYPTVSDTFDSVKAVLNKQIREDFLNEMVNDIKAVGSRYTLAYGGPPCFLEPEKIRLNQLEDFGSAGAIFAEILEIESIFEENQISYLSLKYPGTEVELSNDPPILKDPLSLLPGLEQAFSDRRGYLSSYSDKFHKSLPIAQNIAQFESMQLSLIDLVKNLIDPIIGDLNLIRKGINARILIATDKESVVVDLLSPGIYGFSGQLCRYRLYFDENTLFRAYLEAGSDCFRLLFFALNFRVETEGFNNDMVYAFLMSLNVCNIALLEDRLAADPRLKDEIIIGDYTIQRYCPHLKADLIRFSKSDGKVLKCTLHGWEFDLETGQCLTRDDRKLFTTKKPK